MKGEKIRLAVIVSRLTIGGAEQLLLELLRNIDRERFAPKLFFLREPGLLGTEFLEMGFPVSTGIIRAKFDLSGVWRLQRQLKDFQTDVVFLINHLNTLFFGVLAAKMAGVKGCINWENETFKRYPFHFLTMLGRRVLHLGIDYVVAAAQGHGEYVAVEEKVPRGKIRVIYNGVDPARFQSEIGPDEARERLSIPPGSPTVSIVAALRPDKAHHIFLQAAAMVLEAIPETHFLVIGDGPRREFLEGLSGQLGLERNVHFLGFRRGLGDIFRAVDINCLSSYPKQETLSVAALEAMSAGIPIISTDVGFMKEIVIPEETGYLVPVDDSGALAKRVIHLLKNDELRDKMGSKAKDMVRKNFTIAQMTLYFEQLMITAAGQAK